MSEGGRVRNLRTKIRYGMRFGVQYYWAARFRMGFFIREGTCSRCTAMRPLQGSRTVLDEPTATWSAHMPLLENLVRSAENVKGQWLYLVGWPHSLPQCHRRILVIFFGERLPNNNLPHRRHYRCLFAAGCSVGLSLPRSGLTIRMVTTQERPK